MKAAIAIVIAAIIISATLVYLDHQDDCEAAQRAVTESLDGSGAELVDAMEREREAC